MNVQQVTVASEHSPPLTLIRPRCLLSLGVVTGEPFGLGRIPSSNNIAGSDK